MDSTCFLKPEQLEDFEEHSVNKVRVDSSPCAHPCTPRVALLVHEFAHRRHAWRDAPWSNRYYAGEELEARPAETARTMDILLDEPFRAPHTQQPFENTTATFRGFVPTDYPQASMYPNSMAAELVEDVPLSFPQARFTEGFGQSSYEVTAGSGEIQAQVPAHFPGTTPGVGYWRVDVDGAGFEQTSTEQGLHLSSGTGSAGVYPAHEELEARPAETARAMDILLDEPMWCAHTEQLFENTTQPFRVFDSTGYPQTSMCPDSMSAELGEDVPPCFPPPGFTEGFGQSSYEVRAGSGETQAQVLARSPGTIPRFGYTQVDVDGAAFEQTSTEQALHTSSGTVSAAVFVESPPHAEEGNSAEHPFTRLPPVLPGVVGREIHSLGRYHPGLTSSLSTPDVLDVIRKIYSKPVLGQADVDDLIKAVETLLYIARIQPSPQLSSRTPIILLANTLSGYFLVYDAVVSAAVLLQTELTQYSWWKEFTGLHDTGVVLRGPTSRAQKPRPVVAFCVRLVNRLSAALDILKTGVLPGKGETRDLKLMIFCHKYSPKHFRNTRWSPWRDAEKQYRSRHGDSFH
ncbi:hypothetical protein Efla_000102 [Eimeria flavescens]